MTYLRCPNARWLLSAVVSCLFIMNTVVWADFEFGIPKNLGPQVNSLVGELGGTLSADGLTLIFASNRAPGGLWDYDLWMTTRTSKEDAWGPAEHLGDVLNSRQTEWTPWLTPDGLELYFAKGPSGNTDIHVSRRDDPSEPWGVPENLGPAVNSNSWDGGPTLTADGLEMIFRSSRTGNSDLYVSTRASTAEPWSQAISLGPTINTDSLSGNWGEMTPQISPDGLILFFSAPRSASEGTQNIWMTRRATRESPWQPPMRLPYPVNTAGSSVAFMVGEDVVYLTSGQGDGFWWDLWEIEVTPLVDFNADGLVDVFDVLVMTENWGIVGAPEGPATTLCDVAPFPMGDGVVDARDLAVLAQHMINGDE